MRIALNHFPVVIFGPTERLLCLFSFSNIHDGGRNSDHFLRFIEGRLVRHKKPPVRRSMLVGRLRNLDI
jgi:hypothetical protein